MTDFNCVSKLEYMPVEEETFQKCWSSSTTLMKLGVGLATNVMISTRHYDIICQAWSREQLPINSLWYSDIVRKKTGRKFTGTEIKCMKTSHANHVTVIIVVEHYNDVKNMRSDLKHNPRKIEAMCANILNKFCIAADYVVSVEKMHLANLYGIHCLLITSCAGEISDGYLINSQCKFSVADIMSRERYYQRFNRKPVQIGGLEKEAQELCEILKVPFLCKSIMSPKPKGILLRGPAGTGKTSLVKYIGYECNAYIITVNGPEVFGARPGETENNLSQILDKALTFSEEGSTILFFDEIDALCPDKRQRDKGVNASELLMEFFDRVVGNDNIMVIGATNRPSSIDLGLRRPGRFDKEVMINVPGLTQRKDILKTITSSLPLSSDVSLDRIAFLTNGYVGADLVSLCREAALLVLLDDKTNSDKKKEIEMCHFESSVRTVMPSIKKGTVGLVELSPVDWSQIGGLQEVKAQIKQAVEWPILYPESFRRLGLPCPKGVLLHGPPGCCKTTLVRAAATATNATFITLSGAQLYSPFVGDSERLISEVFQKARAAAPSIIFLDEIDSIIGKRSEGSSTRGESSTRGIHDRVLSALLNEMDGIGIKLDDKIHSTQKLLEGDTDRSKSEVIQTFKTENRNVLLVAATNRPDLLDDALIRPGRIDRILYVPPPDREARLEILKVYSRKMPLRGVDLETLADNTHLYSGADLQNLCREAALLALTENLHADCVSMEHFNQALVTVEPSLTSSLIERYSKMSKGRI